MYTKEEILDFFNREVDRIANKDKWFDLNMKTGNYSPDEAKATAEVQAMIAGTVFIEIGKDLNKFLGGNE